MGMVCVWTGLCCGYLSLWRQPHSDVFVFTLWLSVNVQHEDYPTVMCLCSPCDCQRSARGLPHSDVFVFTLWLSVNVQHPTVMCLCSPCDCQRSARGLPHSDVFVFTLWLSTFSTRTTPQWCVCVHLVTVCQRSARGLPHSDVFVFTLWLSVNVQQEDYPSVMFVFTLWLSVNVQHSDVCVHLVTVCQCSARGLPYGDDWTFPGAADSLYPGILPAHRRPQLPQESHRPLHTQQGQRSCEWWKDN